MVYFVIKVLSLVNLNLSNSICLFTILFYNYLLFTAASQQIHHNSRIIKSNNKHSINNLDYRSLQTDYESIYINQTDNLNVVAKVGHTISLPCMVYKNTNDQQKVHVIWYKLNEKHRARVLSVGLQQLTLDMRFRVRNNARDTSTLEKSENNETHKTASSSIILTNVVAVKSSSEDKNNSDGFIIENWQLEIRKLTFDDSGVYQCSLPLIIPKSKNVTLKVIPDLIMHPRKGLYIAGQNIHLKCHTNLTQIDKRFFIVEDNVDKRREQKENLIIWHRNGIKIDANDEKSNPNLIIHTHLTHNNDQVTSELVINNAKSIDNGIYMCMYDGATEQSSVTIINENAQNRQLLSPNSFYKINNSISIYLFTLVSFFISLLYIY